METWFDIEWYDSNVGWRLAKDHLSRKEVNKWLDLWRGKYQCRLIEVTQTRRVIVDAVIVDHCFKPKDHALHAITIYGSELAGDIMACDHENCGRSEAEHKYSHMYSEEYRRHREEEENVSGESNREL